MLIIEKRKHGITFATVWYAEKKVGKKGIITYRSAKEPIDAGAAESNTLISDLAESEEEIIGKYSKNCRYEIRRAPKEGITCEWKVGKELSESDIQEFSSFFSDFWKSKGIEDNQQEKYAAEIREYAKQGAFAISKAKKGDKILVYHTYIIGDDFVRLYQSASQFRVDEEVPYQVIGMANRLLHKEDMLYFKQKGIKMYDWGGAGRGEDVASITKFKESFGGKPTKWYNSESIVGIKARCFKILVKIVGKVRD